MRATCATAAASWRSLTGSVQTRLGRNQPRAGLSAERFDTFPLRALTPADAAPSWRLYALFVGIGVLLSDPMRADSAKVLRPGPYPSQHGRRYDEKRYRR